MSDNHDMLDPDETYGFGGAPSIYFSVTAISKKGYGCN
jgi:hypothetical protein